MNPTKLSALLKQVIEAHQQGDYAQAEPLYEQILQQRPSHPEALNFGMLRSQKSICGWSTSSPLGVFGECSKTNQLKLFYVEIQGIISIVS